jgi:hypothetical protein
MYQYNVISQRDARHSFKSVLSRAVQPYEIAPLDAKSKSTLINFVNIVATYTELRYFKAERSARRLGLAIGIVSSI